MGLESLGADGCCHPPKNRGHPQRPAPDDEKAKIFSTLASIGPPTRVTQAGGGSRERVDVEYGQGLPARGVLAAFLLSSDTTAAAPKGWHSPPIQFPRHSVIAHEARSRCSERRVPMRELLGWRRQWVLSA
jgi:hypothetical protein